MCSSKVLAELRRDELPGCYLENDRDLNTLPSAVMYVSVLRCDGIDAEWLNTEERKVRDAP